jgi:hypothetical protein
MTNDNTATVSRPRNAIARSARLRKRRRTGQSSIVEATKTGPSALTLCSYQEATMRGFIIGVLLVAVGVLGYLYWDSEHNTVFKAPGVEIKKN